LYIFKNHLLKIVPDRDLARLATFLLKVQHPLVTGMIKTAAAKCGHRASTGSSVNQDCNNRAIPKAYGARRSNRSEQLAGVLYRDLWRLPFNHLVAFPTY